MTKNAAIYARISQDRDGTALGVERQVEDCERIARERDLNVVAIYEDNDVSAYSGKARPGYEALVRAVTDGRVSVVLAWHEDRLHRSPRELEDYIDACQPSSVPTYFAQSGEVDLTTASGRMTARIRGAVARQESEHKSERISRKHEQSARAGVWRGGGRPFGWKVADGGTSAVLDEAEAEAVREACSTILAGGSLGGIVKDWNARGIVTARGGTWSYASLRQVLRRPKNAGLSELRGEVVGSMQGWPPIVSEDTWRSVRTVLDDPARRRSTTNRARWLLAGIATCGKDGCGAPLRSATVGSGRGPARKNRSIYRCTESGGGHVSRSAAQLDEHVTGVVLGVLARGEWRTVDAPSGPDGEALRVEAVTLRSRLDDAADEFADGKITSGQMARITERVNARLAEVEQWMARSSRVDVLEPFEDVHNVAAVWDSLGIDRQRAVVRELMTVTVLPTGRGGSAYRPDAVRIEPRGQA